MKQNRRRLQAEDFAAGARIAPRTCRGASARLFPSQRSRNGILNEQLTEPPELLGSECGPSATRATSGDRSPPVGWSNAVTASRTARSARAWRRSGSISVGSRRPSSRFAMIDAGDEQPIAPLALQILKKPFPVDSIPVEVDQQDRKVVQPARAASQDGRSVPDAVVDDAVAELVLRRQRGQPMAAE